MENFKCGFVSIIGKPNVGKSTLMNKFINEKLSIISPKPQTTRQQVKGILSDDEKQIVFLDTPGFVEARYELHERMLEYIIQGLKDADVIIYITDAHKYPTNYDKQVCKMLEPLKKVPKIAVLNKIDLVDETIANQKLEQLKELDFEACIGISALNDVKVDELLEDVTKLLPYGPPLYDPEHISDLPLRFFASEIIREQIFLNYKDEIPYSTAVVVEDYKDFENKAEIRANIWLERKSQKPILLGKNGEMIKKIRHQAEKEIHKLIQKRVKLDLWVKLKHNWRKKKNALKEFGYQ